MESIEVFRSPSIDDEFVVPGDKSISHRAMLLAALAEGESEIHNVLAAEDCLNTADCLRAMGVGIHHSILKGDMTVKGVGLHGLQAPGAMLDCGNSGTAMRLLLGVLSGQPFSATLTGDASLQKRPMNRVMLPLRMMGAKFSGLEREDRTGALNLFPPIGVQGSSKLKGITYELPMASAQVKSAILLAGLFSKEPTTVIEPEPTRDHTERMLMGMGLKLDVLTVGHGKKITLHPGPLHTIRIEVPGDISAAAFWLVAASILPGSRLIIRDVGLNPTRTGVLDVLKSMGADFFTEKVRTVCGETVGDICIKATQLKATTIAGALIPRLIDEIPILAVAAACAQGETIIKDAQELRVKESDRIKTVVSQLLKMGVNIRETEDGMIIQGDMHAIKGGRVSSHGDHRIAMSCAILGLLGQGPTVIEDTACIATSYPSFERTLRKVLRIGESAEIEDEEELEEDEG